MDYLLEWFTNLCLTRLAGETIQMLLLYLPWYPLSGFLFRIYLGEFWICCPSGEPLIGHRRCRWNAISVPDASGATAGFGPTRWKGWKAVEAMGPGMILNRRALVTSESGRSLWGSRSCGRLVQKGSTKKMIQSQGSCFFWRSVIEEALQNIKKTQVISLELQNAELVKALRLRGAAPSSDSVVRLHEFHEASHMRHPWGNMESSWKWWFPILAREPKKTCEIPWIIFLQGVYRHRFAGYLRVSNTIIRVFEFLKENFHYPLCWNGFEKPLQLLGYGRFVSSPVRETVGSFSPENYITFFPWKMMLGVDVFPIVQ